MLNIKDYCKHIYISGSLEMHESNNRSNTLRSTTNFNTTSQFKILIH